MISSELSSRLSPVHWKLFGVQLGNEAGRKVLGKGALVTAYILFAIAFGTLGIVLYSVISSDAPPNILPLPSLFQ
jgi:hypothetical protein